MYDPGFSIGKRLADDVFVYYNHFNIVIMYHADPAEYDGYRIVGFEVYPTRYPFELVETLYSFVNHPSRATDARTDCHPEEVDLDRLPTHTLPAEGASTILYTYSVEFMEEPDLTWAHRWDLYLANLDPHIHWYSIVNSIAILFVMSSLVAVILIRTLRNDIHSYNEDEKVSSTRRTPRGRKIVRSRDTHVFVSGGAGGGHRVEARARRGVPSTALWLASGRGDRLRCAALCHDLLDRLPLDDRRPQSVVPRRPCLDRCLCLCLCRVRLLGRLMLACGLIAAVQVDWRVRERAPLQGLWRLVVEEERPPGTAPRSLPSLVLTYWQNAHKNRRR